jgi:hypothetical protein
MHLAVNDGHGWGVLVKESLFFRKRHAEPGHVYFEDLYGRATTRFSLFLFIFALFSPVPGDSGRGKTKLYALF